VPGVIFFKKGSEKALCEEKTRGGNEQLEGRQRQKTPKVSRKRGGGVRNNPVVFSPVEKTKKGEEEGSPGSKGGGRKAEQKEQNVSNWEPTERNTF